MNDSNRAFVAACTGTAGNREGLAAKPDQAAGRLGVDLKSGEDSLAAAFAPASAGTAEAG